LRNSFAMIVIFQAFTQLIRGLHHPSTHNQEVPSVLS
jgi:hypothetical protein